LLGDIIGDDNDSIVSLHGVGPASPCMELSLKVLEDQCEKPCRLTYRYSKNFYQDLFAIASAEKAKYAFGVGHEPLRSDLWSNLTTKENGNNQQPVFQLPYRVSALGLYMAGTTTTIKSRNNNNDILVQRINWTVPILSKIFLGTIHSLKDDELSSLLIDSNEEELLNDNDSIAIGLLDIDPFSVAESMTKTWTKYLKTIGEIPDNWSSSNITTGTTNTLSSSSVKGLIQKMVDYKGLILAFLPVDAVTNSNDNNNTTSNLIEVPIPSYGGGNYLTSSQVASAQRDGNLYSSIPSMNQTVVQDLTIFHNSLSEDPNVWPLLTVDYVYIRGDIKNKMGYVQRGLLLALIKFILYFNKEQSLCREYDFGRSIPETLKQQLADPVMTELEKTFYEYEEFVREDDNGNTTQISNATYVLTSQRRSFRDYELQQIQDVVIDIEGRVNTQSQNLKLLPSPDEINALSNTLSSLREQYESMSKRLEQLENDNNRRQTLEVKTAGYDDDISLDGYPTEAKVGNDDDIPPDLYSYRPEFTQLDQTHIRTALVLGSISFGLWTLYIFGRLYWLFC